MSIAEEPTPTETIPIELTPAEKLAEHNAATLNPEAPADTHATQPVGQHIYLFAGDGDSLGSLNEVLNKLTAEKVPVLDVRRVWAVKCMASMPSTSPTEAQAETPEVSK